MTWGEFKKLVEDAGVKDDWEISYMDFNGGDEISITPRCAKGNGQMSFLVEG